jgi:hypothetical protein
MAKANTVQLQRLRVGQLQHRLAAQQSNFENIAKTITLKDIYGRFVAVLGRDDFDLDWPIGKVIRGAGGAVFDFAVKLMQSTQFQADGLILQKKDVLACKLIGALLKLILNWYESNGWVVD